MRSLTVKSILGLLGVVLLMALLIPLIANTFPPILVIQTDSMSPVINPGDVVVLKKHFDAIENHVGKVIAFFDPFQKRNIVHRAIGYESGYLITKGDNSNFADFYRPDERHLLGEVVWVFGTGKFSKQ